MSKRRMIDTHLPEHEEMVDDSRTRKRTERKRVQSNLDTLGRELESLRPKALDALGLSTELRDALRTLATMQKGNGFARQRRLVARLLREHDTTAISKRLEEITGTLVVDERPHEIERWSVRLIEEGDAALEELVTTYPDADRQRLRQAVRLALAERERGERRGRWHELRARVDELLPRD